MAADALTLTNIDAFYGDSHVLHHISLTLREGTILALLGRNGAGKTTTLSSIIGWVRARHGTISLFGKPITNLPPESLVAQGLAIVPQGRRVFPTLSVRENLAVASRGTTKGSASGGRGPWTLARVYETFPRLAERRTQSAGSLSGGEQQMLAIGRALMSNPRVLLMDEPSEGLAPQIVAEVGRIIASLREEGLSIILVEQNISLAFTLADDVAILNTGRLVLSGPAAGLAQDHATIDRHLGVF